MGDQVNTIKECISTLSKSWAQRLPTELKCKEAGISLSLRSDPVLHNTLEECDKEIEQLERIQDDLQLAIQSIKRQAKYTRAALAPIAYCPLEILVDIFYLMPLEPDTSIEEVDNEAQRLLSITAVCRKWRRIALSTRKLWTRIHTSWCTPQQEEWLKRSDTAFIHIIIESPRQLSFPSGKLLAQSHRWISISCRENYKGAIYLALKMLTKLSSLPNLEVIEFPSYRPAPGTLLEKCDVRGLAPNVPKLHTLSFSSIISIHLETIVGNLKSLSISDATYTLREWHSIFKGCRNVECLSLVNNHISRPIITSDFGHLGKATLPNLCHLSVGFHDRQFNNHLFAMISAPVLQSLRVQHIWSSRTASFKPFVSQHRRFFKFNHMNFSLSSPATRRSPTSLLLTVITIFKLCLIQ